MLDVVLDSNVLVPRWNKEFPGGTREELIKCRVDCGVGRVAA